jgi:hypothetical protein
MLTFVLPLFFYRKFRFLDLVEISLRGDRKAVSWWRNDTLLPEPEISMDNGQIWVEVTRWTEFRNQDKNIMAATLQLTAAIKSHGVPGALFADNGAHDVPHGIEVNPK